MLKLTALVGAGGALGSIARFWLGAWALRLTGPGFPWGTMAINVAGSLAIGWLSATLVLARTAQANTLTAFAMVGLCGGFTTFSSFSLQTLELLRAGRVVAAGLNVAASVVLCLGATFVGLALGK